MTSQSKSYLKSFKDFKIENYFYFLTSFLKNFNEILEVKDWSKKTLILFLNQFRLLIREFSNKTHNPRLDKY